MFGNKQRLEAAIFERDGKLIHRNGIIRGKNEYADMHGSLPGLLMLVTRGPAWSVIDVECYHRYFAIACREI